MSLEENVNENVKPETSTENKTENNTGENREESTKMARRPQNRRPRRVPRVPKAVMAEEKEENGSRETAEPKTDLVIPDVSYLKQNIDKVKGFVITHGHEDHIGALPYILQQVNVPVYGTKLTIALIEHKLKEHNLLKNTKRKVMKHGQSVNLGCFRVEFIKTNHSIQDASALAIFSPVGIVLHTGDFKIDYTPVFGDPIDLQRFAELGKKGVLAMLADSTNATRPGFTMSERSVGKTFDTIFAEHTNHRIIVATFASNVDRVQQVVNTAYKYGRKVVVEGRSMVTIIDIASELGYINIPEGTLIDIDQLKNYPWGCGCIKLYSNPRK